MKKVVLCCILVVMLFPVYVDAQKGCCSWHGGVAGCDQSGRTICKDGSLSPSCRCTPVAPRQETPTYRYGCTDQNALNYDSSANKDNGSCISKVYGCQNAEAINYNSGANVADGSCQFEKIEIIEEEVKYKSKTIDGKEEKTKQKGENGKKSVTKRVTYDESSNIVKTEIIEETTLEEPVEEILVKVPDTGIESDNTSLPIIILMAGGLTFFSYKMYKKQNRPL